MSYANGPRIVTDGLVLHLDAANSKTINGFDLAGSKSVSFNTISIGNYTPTGAGNTSKAFIFPNSGTKYPTISDSNDFDFRGEISWDFVACKTSSTGRQSVWSQINTVSPWNGMGVVSMSRDSNGQLAWWGGNYNQDYTGSGPWWDTGISLDINKWYYCAGTWSSLNRKVYARTIGSSSFATALTGTSSLGYFNGSAASNTFRLGDNGTETALAGHILDGAISFVRIYNRQLSDIEIEQNYNALKGRYGLT